jgi:hypothetical protein
MVPISNAVYFPKVQEIFDENGELKGKSQQGQAQRLLAELIWYAQVLKAAREKEPEEETAEGS